MIEPLSLAPNYKIAVGLLSGMILGFLLVKSDLAWRDSWLEFFQLRSGRIIKTLLMAIILGSIFFFLARNAGIVHIQVRPGYFWTSLLGGAISGLGAALAGLVPITAVASFATGKIYALAALVGMLLAIPVMHWTRGILAIFVENWAVALPGASRATEFFDVANPAIWVCAIGAALLALVHYTLGSGD